MAAEHADAGGRDWRDYLLAFSVALGLAAGGFLLANLLSIPLVIVFSVIDTSLRSAVGTAASTLVQGIAFVLVVLGYMRYGDHPRLLDIRWPSLSRLRRTLRDAGWVVAGFVVLLIASQAVGLVLQQFGLAPGTNRVVDAVRADPTLALYLVVLSFLATGPGEEVLFRGGVQGVLRRVLSPVGAVIGSSALFGLAHVTAIVAASGAGGVWGYVVSTFVLGIVLGALYEYTDNLLVPILVHGAYNAVLFVQLYLVETSSLGFLPTL
ncbi:CPBP family intramembrane glutamic endopeptidase [Halococcus sp. AFM35]|uniref:CPBP family intramembrane glutamic endopeptidase n=1 Tax=Halococcus sp. AFM35 TaxID=3421653 RepID=UPI003EBA5F6D